MIILFDIPPEIIIDIVKYNDINDISKLLITCKIFNNLIFDDKILWKNYLYRDFDKEYIKGLINDYKTHFDVYKKCYILKRTLLNKDFYGYDKFINNTIPNFLAKTSHIFY